MLCTFEISFNSLDAKRESIYHLSINGYILSYLYNIIRKIKLYYLFFYIEKQEKTKKKWDQFKSIYFPSGWFTSYNKSRDMYIYIHIIYVLHMYTVNLIQSIVHHWKSYFTSYSEKEEKKSKHYVVPYVWVTKWNFLPPLLSEFPPLSPHPPSLG